MPNEKTKKDDDDDPLVTVSSAPLGGLMTAASGSGRERPCLILALLLFARRGAALPPPPRASRDSPGQRPSPTNPLHNRALARGVMTSLLSCLFFFLWRFYVALLAVGYQSVKASRLPLSCVLDTANMLSASSWSRRSCFTGRGVCCIRARNSRSI